MKTRNQSLKQGVALFYSVRAIALALALALSLTALSSVSASAPEEIDTASAPEEIDTASSYRVVVNKIRPLSPVTYKATDLVKVAKFNPYGRILRSEVAASVIRMGNDMKAAGKGTLIVQSGYRSYYSQKSILAAKIKAVGETKALKLVAKPGYSEHQTGLAVDFAAKGVSTLTVSFARTKAGIWLAANAYRYGFILRYPSGKTDVTGYSFEPWHFRYVGVDMATAMLTQHITTMEEYYRLPAAPAY